MTKEERKLKEMQLKQLQALPLEIKIEKTKQRIREFYNELGGKVYISYSGGKDSTVLLDIVRSLYPNVLAVYSDTGLEYPELKNFVKKQSNVEIIRPKLTFDKVIDKVGFPVISKEVSLLIYYAKKGSKWALYKLEGKNNKGNDDKFKHQYMKYKYLVDSPFKISDKCCYVMKKEPFKRFERERVSTNNRNDGRRK